MITLNGVITATAIDSLGGPDGDSGATYILTPTVAVGQVQWGISGSCVAEGLC